MIPALGHRAPRACRLCALISLSFGFLGTCVSAAEPGDEAARKGVKAEIVKLIGDAPCANLVHCRVLPLGSKPCGGAEEYLAYSSLTGNKDLLESKAFEYGFLQEQAMRGEKPAGTCEQLPPPRAMCLDRRCRLDGSPR